MNQLALVMKRFILFRNLSVVGAIAVLLLLLFAPNAIRAQEFRATITGQVAGLNRRCHSGSLRLRPSTRRPGEVFHVKTDAKGDY